MFPAVNVDRRLFLLFRGCAAISLRSILFLGVAGRHWLPLRSVDCMAG